MVNKVTYPRQVSVVFAALADPTRRRLLERLASSDEMQVTALARPFRISLPAITKHLHVLERARLIRRRRQGRLHLIRTRKEGLQPAQDWIAHYVAGWLHSFDALDVFVEKQKAEFARQRKKEKKA